MKILIGWTLKTSILGHFQRMKTCHIVGKKYLQDRYLLKDLYPKIQKELLKFSNKKTNSSIKKYRKGLNRHTDGKKQIKICTAACVIRELQIKTMACHYTSVRMAKIQNTDNTKC